MTHNEDRAQHADQPLPPAPVEEDKGTADVDRPEGPISAAIIAAGVGAAALGLFTTLAEASTGVAEWMQWNDRVGPLSGKTLMAVIVWLVSWAILHLALRNKPRETGRALTVALVLIGLGVLGTFPTFFQLFAPE
ncbi:hypothetical protein [Streptomyces sp. NPDC057877]|uniref:hypothetical protein n=1 Tax=Streptomyces sp. NPDC057877 TaxID=3346269 RepID=UPI003699316B